MFAGGNNPIVDIGIAMTLQDKFSGPAGNIMSRWKSTLGEMSNYSTGVQRAFTNGMRANTAFVKAIGESFVKFAGLSKEAFLTNKILNDTIDHQRDLINDAKELNLKNPLQLADIVSGQKFMAMAGHNYETIKDAIKPAADMAALFNMELGGKGGTADLLTNIMSTFQLKGKDAKWVGDVLSVGTTSANISLQDLAQSIKYAGANAKMAGMDIKDVTAAIGVLGNYGIQGSMAGTNLGQALNTMNKAITGASDKGLNALHALGLSPADLQTVEGNLIPVHEILQKIAAATRDMGDVQKQGILFNLFGQRGLRAIVPLLEDINSGANNYLKIMSKLNNSGEWLESSIQDYMENNPMGQLQKLAATWDNLMISVGEASGKIFYPLLKNYILPVVDWIAKVANQGWAQWVVQGSLIIASLKIIRGLIGSAAVTCELISTGIAGSAAGSKALTGGVRSSVLQAARLEYHFRNITLLMGEMAALSLPIGKSIQLYGGSITRTAQGTRWTANQGERKGATSMFGNMPGGTFIGTTNSAVGGSGAGAGSTARVGGVTGAMSRGFGLVGKGLTRTLGFLMGPWGMAIQAAIMFVPMIWKWLIGSKDDTKSQEEILEAKKREQANLMYQSLMGKPATVNVNVNGRQVASVSPGDFADVDVDDTYGFGY